MATRNGNRIVVDCAPGIGTMHSDPTRIRQALLNLVSNANKFTEGGNVTISANRAIQDGCEWITVAVTDTGIGLTPAQIGTLFQNFVQADTSTTRKYGGTGLGLAISRRFCQMMGGDITVASAVGRGSTFTMRLPAEAGDPRHVTRSAEALSPLPTKLALSNLTVLIIDDDPLALDLTERSFAREGYSVVTAHGGHEGLRLQENCSLPRSPSTS